jgi:hypothetical protein
MINTTGLTHPALDKITRITPILSSTAVAAKKLAALTEHPLLVAFQSVQ